MCRQGLKINLRRIENWSLPELLNVGPSHYYQHYYHQKSRLILSMNQSAYSSLGSESTCKQRIPPKPHPLSSKQSYASTFQR